jgi:hypothetical protein
MLTKKEYASVRQTDDSRKVLRALCKLLEMKVKTISMDKKLIARKNTKNKTAPHKPEKGKWRFSRRFFAMLYMMPSIKIDVKESRSHIRKTSYGFRDQSTSDRVYLRIENGSVVMFRDSPACYIIGKRFFFRRVGYSYRKRWDLVQVKMYLFLREKGIRIKNKDITSCLRSVDKWRVMLSDVLICRRLEWYRNRGTIRTTKKVKEAQNENTK